MGLACAKATCRKSFFGVFVQLFPETVKVYSANVGIQKAVEKKHPLLFALQVAKTDISQAIYHNNEFATISNIC